ncbi:TIGR03089 family protein [Solwaraspora sp. WMMD406]|uniref:TIGR03089 family protein n=1 Tax=Solwaraspora sp. WMMD406 TaxID=3016095 RepID=UPI0024178789|nr:TIGR03089 family protein [Solwaraspora sp. WMMD406]MDG4763873.1 TIGR03089 family protein [Solwaraspora sp. WMMD406]
MTNNIAGLLAVSVAADPTRPLITWYDDATGDRTELSGTTLANWVAKTANLVVDAAGAGRGDVAEVWLPAHWQTAAVLLGCWSAGLTVRAAGLAAGAAAGTSTGATSSGGSGTATTTITATPAEVVFAHVDHLADDLAAIGHRSAGERYLLSLAPMAAPIRQLPVGWADYVVEVRGQGDHFTPYPAIDPHDAQLATRARQRATELEILPGSRILIDTDRYPDPVDWLLAPLVAEASVVLCRHLDQRQVAGRAERERVARSLI